MEGPAYKKQVSLSYLFWNFIFSAVNVDRRGTNVSRLDAESWALGKDAKARDHCSRSAAAPAHPPFLQLCWVLLFSSEPSPGAAKQLITEV